MGSGKSALGALVAEQAGVPFLDLDLMIENEAGMSIADIFATSGEAAFRALESRLLPEALQPGAVAALGGGAAVDDSNWRLIGERALSVFVDVSFQRLWERIAGAPHRPLAAGRSRADMNALFQQRLPRYEQSTYRVDGDRPLADIAVEVLKLWRK